MFVTIPKERQIIKQVYLALFIFLLEKHHFWYSYCAVRIINGFWRKKLWWKAFSSKLTFTCSFMYFDSIYYISWYDRAIWWELHTSQLLQEWYDAGVLLLAKWQNCCCSQARSVNSHCECSQGIGFLWSPVQNVWCAVIWENSLINHKCHICLLSMNSLRRGFRESMVHILDALQGLVNETVICRAWAEM